jgi:ABC-type nitrate/sulfonate/bicarbonate transport system substrate-binding protein
MQTTNLEVVDSRYLATHPGTIARYTAAFAEAAQYVRGHRAETADLLMRNFVGVTPTAVRSAVGITSPDMRVSKVTVQGAQQSYDFAIRIKLLKQAPVFEEMFDLRILRQLEREHPDLFRDLPPVPETLKL